MRTLLLLLALAVLAVVSGLSFVVRAAAQGAGSGELNVDCGEPIVIRAGTPVLLTCTAVARNTGSTTLRGAQMEFVPATGWSPPDFYMFWSETHDGVGSVPGPGDLTYDFGDIQPGAASTVGLEIIVRSTRDFGADVVLVAQPDQWAYSRTTISYKVGTGATTPLPVSLVLQDGASYMPPVYRLTIQDPLPARYDNVTVEMSVGEDSIVKEPMEWKATGAPGRFAADLGALASGAEITRDLPIAQLTTGCWAVRPVVVVTVVEAGTTLHLPAIGDSSPPSFCGSRTGGGLALPQGGSGPSARGAGQLRATAAAAAAIGALCFAMGATMRRPRRNRRNEV